MSEAPDAQPCPPVGDGDVVVSEGDCMASIAEAHGFFWQTLWDLPENAELKRVRRDPNVLLPGDRVTVPPLRIAAHAGAVDRRHRFRRRGVPEKLRMQFLDHESQPRAGIPFLADIHGQQIHGETDEQGYVEVWVSPRATRGWIELEPDPQRTLRELHHFDIGHLQPIDSPHGVLARLRALGLHSTGQRLADALLELQRDHGLEPSGEADEATRAKLLELYGS